MKGHPPNLFALSRPRFWSYLFGTYLLGVVAGAPSLSTVVSLPNVIWLLFFLFPANLLIYGVNDLFDYETDRHNPKKSAYEQYVSPQYRQRVAWAMAISTLPFLLALPLLPLPALLGLALFLFFGIFYSAPPIRAKARPGLDALFNILYVFPAVVGYFTAGGNNPTASLFIAGGLWCMAMHAYSAVPDISSDKSAQVRTIATVLGTKVTLILCAGLYAAATALSTLTLGGIAILVGSIYVGLMGATLTKRGEQDIFSVYKLFPIVNFGVGLALTLAILITRLA
jgi:lycopene elongase/hydratase (dihydrobisanhydrobacterioruberin-forming)